MLKIYTHSCIAEIQYGFISLLVFVLDKKEYVH